MLADKLRVAVAAHKMFSPGDLVVVGVSGGPDSVALLHGLSELCRSIDVKLHVAHLDHLLRGPDSTADAASVAALADRLGWPATVVARDVAALARQGHSSLEEAGRIARYTFFGEVVQRTSAIGVAVGHTADDQVETVVLHWLRGAGPGGLRGMRHVSILRWPSLDTSRPPLRVLRPLLDVSHAEAAAYCTKHGLEAAADVTNRDLHFVRNRVRWQLLPELRGYNPRFGEAVRRSAMIAAADDDLLNTQVATLWPKLTAYQENCLSFSLSSWSQLARGLQYRLLREGVSQLQGDLVGLSADHLTKGAYLMATKPAGCSVHWPRGLRLIKRYEDFQLCRGDRAISTLGSAGERIAVPGRTAVAAGRWLVEAQLAQERCSPVVADPWHADLDFGAVGAQLLVRCRRPGDRFVPLGMDRAKKLQDFLVDAKVPRLERDEVPLITGGERIAWLAGLRIAEWAKVTANSERVLCLRFNAQAN